MCSRPCRGSAQCAPPRSWTGSTSPPTAGSAGSASTRSRPWSRSLGPVQSRRVSRGRAAAPTLLEPSSRLHLPAGPEHFGHQGVPRPPQAAAGATQTAGRRGRAEAPADRCAAHRRLRPDRRRQGNRGRPAGQGASRVVRLGVGHHPAAATGRAATACTTVRLGRRVRRDDRAWRAAGVGGRARRAPLRHTARPRGRGARARASRPFSRSICRAPGRCSGTGPARPVRVPGPAELGGAGPPADRPRHRDPRTAERRLATARTELAAVSEFDHVVVNAEIGQAVGDLVDFLGL